MLPISEGLASMSEGSRVGFDIGLPGLAVLVSKDPARVIGVLTSSFSMYLLIMRCDGELASLQLSSDRFCAEVSLALLLVLFCEVLTSYALHREFD